MEWLGLLGYNKLAAFYATVTSIAQQLSTLYHLFVI